MTNVDKMRVRFREVIRIYDDSPAITLTYKDASRLYADLLEVIDIIERHDGKMIGFSKGTPIVED
jgi:hypothetical protein